MSIFGSQWKEDAMKEWEPAIKHFKDGGAIGDLPKECIDSIVAGELAYKKPPQAKKDKEIGLKDQIEQYIESREKEYKDRAQELEGLLLQFRFWLSQKESTEKLMFGEPKYTSKILKEFDDHFKITTQAHGNTDK